MKFPSIGSSQEAGILFDADNERRRRQTVLFLGKTGDGKSTLCNMLLFSDLEGELKTGADVGSVSKQVAVKSNDDWTVIDTVGLGEAVKESETGTRNALIKLRNFFASEPMAVDHICFVMRKGEFTKYERVYWECFKKAFGTNEKHIRLIFTSAGQKWLRANETDIKELIGDHPMISVDFPPRADDSHEESVLRTKRESNLTRLRQFFFEEQRSTGEPAIIGREASPPHQGPSKGQHAYFENFRGILSIPHLLLCSLYAVVLLAKRVVKFSIAKLKKAFGSQSGSSR